MNLEKISGKEFILILKRIIEAGKNKPSYILIAVILLLGIVFAGLKKTSVFSVSTVNTFPTSSPTIKVTPTPTPTPTETPIPTPTLIRATGNDTYKGRNATITLTFSPAGGTVTGQITGNCNGTFQGSFDGKDGGVLTGTAQGGCNAWENDYLAAAAKADGVVSLTNRNIQLHYTGSAGAYASHSNTIMLYFQ